MPSADGALRVFQVSSTTASIGFITLFVQTVLAKYRKQTSRSKADSPGTLSAVTSGDEPQKATTADGGFLRPAKVEPNRAWKKPLRERLEALMVQAHASGSDDSTVEIARAADIYLLAAESLVRPRPGGTAATRAELHAEASKVIRDTTAATASLRKLGPPDDDESKPFNAALAIGLLTVIAALVALIAAVRVEDVIFGRQGVDLARFTLSGKPRPTCLPSGLFAPAISEAARALDFVVAGLTIILDSSDRWSCTLRVLLSAAWRRARCFLAFN